MNPVRTDYEPVRTQYAPVRTNMNQYEPIPRDEDTRIGSKNPWPNLYELIHKPSTNQSQTLHKPFYKPSTNLSQTNTNRLQAYTNHYKPTNASQNDSHPPSRRSASFPKMQTGENRTKWVRGPNSSVDYQALATNLRTRPSGFHVQRASDAHPNLNFAKLCYCQTVEYLVFLSCPRSPIQFSAFE